MGKHRLLNVETGELRPVMVLPRSYSKWRFIMVCQERLGDLARDGDLNLSDLKVLLDVMGKADRVGEVFVVQVDLAEDLGLTRVTVCRALGRLVEKGLLEKDGSRYRLSGDFARRKAVKE